MPTVVKTENTEDEVNNPSIRAGKVINCTNEIEQYRCNRCNFQSIFLASVKRHRKNGCGHETLEEVIYRCAKCDFSAYSQYFLLRHSFSGKCSTTYEVNDPFIKNEVNDSFTTNEVKDSVVSGKFDKRESSPQNEEISVSCPTEGKDASSSKDVPRSTTLTQIENSQFKLQQHGKHNLSLLNKKLQDTNSSQLNSLSYKYSTANNITRFKCRPCSVIFKQKEHLNRHIKCHHFKSVNTPVCRPELSLSPLTEQVWLNQDKKTGLFHCNYCSYRTKSQNDFTLHIKLCYSKSKSLPWLVCKLCSSKFKTKADIVKHQISTHSIQCFECTRCSYKSKDKDDLETHITSCHVELERTVSFQCEYCPVKLKSKIHLYTHKKAVHSVYGDWFKCKQCKCRFRRQVTLTNHLKTHKELWFYCEKCPYKSWDKDELNRHTAMCHKWFECEVCSCRFMTKVILSKHQKATHTGESDMH